MDRANNLDGLRITGALLVLFGHAFVLSGRLGELPLIGGYQLHSLGVVMFFAISGYLISASWNAKRDPVAYFSARCLRIFPALVVVVVVTALVVGPLVTSLSIDDYFGNAKTWQYLQTGALLIAHQLPGVTDGLPFPGSINGSLWTLPMEFACYLLVVVLVVRRWPVRVALLGAMLVTLLWLCHQRPGAFPLIWGVDVVTWARFAYVFVAGALIRAFVERFGRGFVRTDVAVVLAAAHLVIVGLEPTSVHWISWLTLPYIVLAIGLARTPVFSRAARFGDLSYGIYLWAFPVQQVVLITMGPQRMLVNLLVVATVTTVLAFGSWHVVEKPSLALKDRLERRRRSRASMPPSTVPAAS